MRRSYNSNETFSRKVKRWMATSLASVFLAGSIVMVAPGAIQGVQAKQVREVVNNEEVGVLETSKDAFNKYGRIKGIDNNTILGADFSYYQQCLDWKKEYKNYMSQPVDDIFEYVKEQGINTITLKVAVNPVKNEETGKDDTYLSLENAIKTLKAVKQSKTNLKTNLVLLYSDSMTYASTQTLPEGWTEENAAVIY